MESRGTNLNRSRFAGRLHCLSRSQSHEESNKEVCSHLRILFPLYIDDLLMELAESGVGCHWDGSFVSALAYADDLYLIGTQSLCAQDITIEYL